jgi:hypothetical protein
MDVLQRFAVGDQEAFEILSCHQQHEIYRWLARSSSPSEGKLFVLIGKDDFVPADVSM